MLLASIRTSAAASERNERFTSSSQLRSKQVGRERRSGKSDGIDLPLPLPLIVTKQMVNLSLYLENLSLNNNLGL